MPDKLPIDLPLATPGTKYVHGVNVDDLTDGPQGTSQKVAIIPITRETIISQSSVATSQEPTGLDSAMDIEFGPAIAVDAMSLSVTGLFTALETGTYFFDPVFHFGRTSSAGAANLFARALVNGVQAGNSARAKLDDGDTVLRGPGSLFLTMAIGDTLQFQLIRDSSDAGVNNGGLFAGDPVTAGWEDAPTASVTISRITGNAANIQADGDVVGGGASQLNEVATYSSLTGLAIKSTADVSIEAGVIDRLTVGEDLWLKVDSNAENVFIGRHVDGTGVPSLNNTTLLVTGTATNNMAFSTTGNNSQSIDFVKTGTFRCALNNNRDRNSLGLENATGEYIEIRPDKSVVYRASTDAKFGISSSNPTLEFQQANGTVEARISYNAAIANSLLITKVSSNSSIELATEEVNVAGNTTINLDAPNVKQNGVPINVVKAFAHNTASNTSSTTLTGTNQYARCNFGVSMVAPETSDGDWVFSASRFQNLGPDFKGVVTFICDVAHSDSVELLYDLRVSINNETNLQGIWRQLYVPVGKSAHMTVDAYVEVATNDYLQLNIKQPNGTVNFNPVIQRTSFKIT